MNKLKASMIAKVLAIAFAGAMMVGSTSVAMAASGDSLDGYNSSGNSSQSTNKDSGDSQLPDAINKFNDHSSDGRSSSSDSGNSWGNSSDDSRSSSGGDSDIKVPKKDDGTGLGDMLNNYKPVNKDSLAKAEKTAAPVVQIMGTIINVILVVVTIALTGITALDILYVTLPFTRGFLAPDSTNNGISDPTASPSQGNSTRRWVSDEALQAVQEGMGGTSQDAMAGYQGGGQYGSYMGGGYPGGGYQGGGYQGGQQKKGHRGGKSIMFNYFKGRAFFYVVYAVTVILLFSNIFTNIGVDIAEVVMGVFQQGQDWLNSHS